MNIYFWQIPELGKVQDGAPDGAKFLQDGAGDGANVFGLESLLLLDLSEDERLRWRSLRQVSAKWRFLASRAGVRRILAQACGVKPHELKFDLGPFGKPRLVWPETNWQFNWSHSGDVVVMVLAQGVKVGVDVEKLRPIINAGDLVERFFLTEEAARFWATPEAGRSGVFFDIWVRKEAYLKMTGRGISGGWCAAPGGANWQSFSTVPGYVACVCAEKKIDELNVCGFSF